MTEQFPPIKERIVPPALRATMARTGGHQMAGSMRLRYMGEVRILDSREDHGPPEGPPDMRWHVSMSTPHRLPTWEEIKHIQNSLHPGVFFCIPMPPERYWFSLHEYAMHIEEVKDPNSIEQWKAQTRGVERERRTPGSAAGRIKIKDNFDDPLPGEGPRP